MWRCVNSARLTTLLIALKNSSFRALLLADTYLSHIYTHAHMYTCIHTIHKYLRLFCIIAFIATCNCFVAVVVVVVVAVTFSKLNARPQFMADTHSFACKHIQIYIIPTCKFIFAGWCACVCVCVWRSQF